MPKITYVQPDETAEVVDVPVGDSVMRGAVTNDVEGILAQCGGGASCGTCHVYVDLAWTDTLPPMHGVEDELLYCTASPREGNSRLSCQLPVTEDIDGLVVRVPTAQV